MRYRSEREDYLLEKAVVDYLEDLVSEKQFPEASKYMTFEEMEELVSRKVELDGDRAKICLDSPAFFLQSIINDAN